MVVYSDGSNQNIDKELREKGNVIVHDTNQHFDIMVCDLKSSDISKAYKNNINNEDIIIIDIGSKTADDIDNIIKNRCYNISLF